MSKNLDDFAVDLRALKLNMKRGTINKKEYESYLKSLPDSSNEMVEMPAYFEEEEEVNMPEGGADDLTFSVA